MSTDGLEVTVSDRPLEAVRSVIAGASETLLCVAFVHARGLNLVKPALPKRGVRLLSTTVFGSTTSEGLHLAQSNGADVRVLNPSHATFHPKVYLARHGATTRAVVGSANLTGGLRTNVEAVVMLRGASDHPEIARLWDLAEGWWADPRTVPGLLAVPTAPREFLPRDLRRRVEILLSRTRTVFTLKGHKPNTITDLTDDGIWVETTTGTGPQLVPSWMLLAAWEHLLANGRLTNAYLLADDGLNVKRSSFICALFAAFDDVDVVPGPRIELELAPSWAILAAGDPRPYDPRPYDPRPEDPRPEDST